MTKSGRELVSGRAAATSCGTGAEGMSDPLQDDPKLRRALALVLMREAMASLEMAGEGPACCHLQAAIDSLLRRRAESPPQTAN